MVVGAEWTPPGGVAPYQLATTRCRTFATNEPAAALWQVLRPLPAMALQQTLS